MAETTLIEQKLSQLGLDKSPEDFISELPPSVQRRVEVLQSLQDKRDELETQFRKERAELESKYEKLYAPLYTERAEVVSGAKAVPPKEGESAGEDVGSIPEFWCTVLLKNDMTAELVKDKDLEVLKALTDIQAENIFNEEGAPRGFKLTFTFAENAFFSNTTLTKTYFMLVEDDGVLEKSEGTAINWKPGKDVTVKLMKKKGKKGKDSKPQMKTEKIESFFNFFSPPEVPAEDEDIDEETMEELQALIEVDYEVGATIKDKLVGHAVDWYTGAAIEDEPYFFGGDEDEDEEGEDGEDDEDEDEEEEEDSPPPKAGKGKGAKGAKGGKGGEQAPECKQQ